MKGKSAIFWIGLAGVTGFFLFQTSHETQLLEEKLARLNGKIMREQETIQILRADWGYLNELGRIETLARNHLSLQPIGAPQLMTLAQVPMRPVPESPESLPPMAGLAPRMASSQMAPIQPLPTAHTPATSGQPVVLPASASAVPDPSAIQPAVSRPVPAAKPVPPSRSVRASETAIAQKPEPRRSDEPQSIGVLVARLGMNR